MSKADEVRAFLNSFRQIAGTPSRLILLRKHPGSKNAQCILDLEITELEAKEVVFGLSVKDFWKGPEDDRDVSGQQCWFFCPRVQGREIYVKLVVGRSGSGIPVAKILSFHFPEFPISRPSSDKNW